MFHYSSPQVIGGSCHPITIRLESGFFVSLDLFFHLLETKIINNYPNLPLEARYTFTYQNVSFPLPCQAKLMALLEMERS